MTTFKNPVIERFYVRIKRSSQPSISTFNEMDRNVVAEELSRFFGVLAHPLRVLIIEELRNGEMTVTDLKDNLKVSQTSVSQHLGILRSNKFVMERRDGRHVYYHLRHIELADLLVECISFISPDETETRRILSAIVSTRSKWSKKKAEKSQKVSKKTAKHKR